MVCRRDMRPRNFCVWASHWGHSGYNCPFPHAGAVSAMTPRVDLFCLVCLFINPDFVQKGSQFSSVERDSVKNAGWRASIREHPTHLTWFNIYYMYVASTCTAPFRST